MWPSFRGKIGLAYALFREEVGPPGRKLRNPRDTVVRRTSEVKVVFEKLRLTLTLIFFREKTCNAIKM